MQIIVTKTDREQLVIAHEYIIVYPDGTQEVKWSPSAEDWNTFCKDEKILAYAKKKWNERDRA
jgi:hypothetical protein